MLPACLVEDPPSYVAPTQTPPRLDYRRAEPLLDQVIVAKTGDKITFRMPVVSEDAGVPLTALMLLDYSGPNSAGPGMVPGATLPASTLDDTSRVFEIDFNIRGISAGCHRFTLRATHRPNVDVVNYPELFDPSDSAEAYWWANIDIDPNKPSQMLTECPGASRDAAP